MIKIGLFGCGRIGKVHARTLSQTPKAKLVAVCDAVPEAALVLAAEYGVEVRDSAGILNAKDIDAVIIGSPTDTHLDLITQAAENGKAIFCEKPIERSLAHIQAAMQVVARYKVPFMTGFNRRFDPNFQSVAARITAGDIGNVELVTILSRDPAPPPIAYIKTSGGIFRDMMIHDFDMARFLLGEDPISVYAVGSSLVDSAIGDAGDIDTAVVTLKTETGKICQISNSRRASYGYDQRIEVHGAKGMLRADNLHESSVEYAGTEGFTRAPLQHFFLERYEAAYRNEIGHFVAAIEQGAAVSPSIEDGLKAQILAESAAESLETGQAVALEALRSYSLY